MPYSTLAAAKEGGFLTRLDEIPLTLAQVNEIARQYDAVKAEGSADNPMAVAIAAFKKAHKHNDDDTAWVAKKVEEAMVKEPWELTVDDLPTAFRDYPKLAKETALSFFRVALDGGFTEEEAAEIALAAVAKKWQRTDGTTWKYTGEAEPAIRYTGNVLRESAICETVAFDLEPGAFEIREAEADGFKRIVAPLLCVGFSKNKGEITESHVESRKGKFYPRYYPATELERVAPLCEGLTVYVGFDEHNDQVDVPKELGVYEGAHFARGAIRGAVKVFKDQNWVVDRLACTPRAFGGLSVEGGAGHRHGYVDNTEAAVVQGLKVGCARLVKRPAAAGAIEGIRESEHNNRKGGVYMKLADLNEADRDEVMREAKGIVETEQNVKAKDAKIAELTEAVKKKDDELKATNTKLHEAESYKLVEEAMPRDAKGEHTLPEKARALLHESLKGQMDKTVVEAEVKKVAEIVAEAAAAGRPVGAGAGGQKPGEPSPVIKEAKADLNKFFGVQEAAPATAPVAATPAK